MKKLFVGGYYDDRIFEGEYFEGKTPFGKDIDTYTLDEVLKLGFVEPVVEWHEENREDDEKEWDDLTEIEKAQFIAEYTEGDEIAVLLYFSTEEEAENYKNEVIESVEELEKEIKYVGKKQDNYGNFRDVYVLKDED